MPDVIFFKLKSDTKYHENFIVLKNMHGTVYRNFKFDAISTKLR